MNLFKEQQQAYRDAIEESLPSFLPPQNSPQGKVVEAMEYSLCGGGKRVRGILLLAFYQLFGGTQIQEIIPFSASIEMIHAYSLIHDDLPCMDNDDLRRGKPSCHIAFGEATALLAGDGLLNLAFETLSHVSSPSISEVQILQSIKILSYASGVQGMIGGQVMDLDNENQSVSGEVLEQTDHLKTGALITAACEIGSVLGNATLEQRTLVRQFGDAIGLAFQIMDDILDVTSTEETLGKPINSDVENEKSTYTGVYGLENAKKMVETLTEKAISSLEQLVLPDSSFLRQFALELAQRTH